MEVQGFSAHSLNLHIVKSIAIFPGRYYRLRYRALNVIGWSGFSDISYVMSARIADTPVPPTITLW